ncbi:MAG: sigma 54-interacting transcriptional regulator, partial [Clostridiaceae bacterium]|nr:sigma 54-interacting transcriptional regulator [Clostridiaceae bacterium]
MNIEKFDNDTCLDSELEYKQTEALKFNNGKPYVINGWERCKEKRVERNCKICIKVYEGKQLTDILEQNKDLIAYSKIFMENLSSFVKDSGFAVVLADSKARILEVMANEEILKGSLQDLNFIKGAIWDEEHVGNTAISTAIIEKQPVQICGLEHYCKLHRNWTCSAAPIKKDGEVIGVLNVSGLNRDVHSHTLGMVVAAAHAIETEIKSEKAKNEILIKNKLQDALVESMSDGVLLVDKGGYVGFINEIGADILGVNRANAIGRHITELVDFRPVVLEVLRTGVGYVDKEFIVENTKGNTIHFIKTAVPIRDESGELVGVVDTFRKIQRVQKMVNDMVGAYAKFTFDDIIGNDDKFKECIRLAKIAAESSSNVLIQGESGTGKELLAHAIHSSSSRRKEPFITINCAAIPRELIESELFGYQGGAFTGALKNGRSGKFELANRGSIFLDEIGEMPLDMQVKLLRVIQDKQFNRIGGSNVFNTDVRIICATNKNLFEECNNGNFRWDLYYRLNVLSIETVPLRDRISSIIELSEYLIRKINNRLNKNVKGIDESVLYYFLKYDWPGNVRELENTIERAINICEGEKIILKDLPKSILKVDVAVNGFTEKTVKNPESFEIESL